MIRALVFASALVLVGGGAAVAVPGLDPAPRDPVKIMFEQKLGSGVRFTFDSVPFVPANPGWDFGDREAYSCAFMEYMDTVPSVLAYVEFERIDGLTQSNGSPYVIVNDKGDGPETSDGNPPGPGALQTGAACGTIGHGGAIFDGSDHFPHFTTMHPGGLHFLDAATDAEFAFLNLTRGECNKAYYSPGNEAGEAILWWDADGPENDGHGDLACGGGGKEPIAIARVFASHLAPGIVACVDDSGAFGGRMCRTGDGVWTEPPKTG